MTVPNFARSVSLAVFATTALAAPSLAVPSHAMAAGVLDAYLPKSGKIQGHVMTLGVAPEDQAIDKQFRVAVQNNMDWFKKYVQNNKPGQPLPYDRRMGISEAQYQKLQHMKADFRAGDPVEITVNKGADGKVSFASKDASAAALAKVTFGADEKVAETPQGALSIFNEIHQKSENAPLGVWDGAEWARVSEEGSDQPSAKLAFGKRTPSGEGILYYMIAPHDQEKEQSLVVFYKLD